MDKGLIKNYKQWLWLIPFIAFLLDWFLIYHHQTTHVDYLMYHLLHTIQTPLMTTIFKGITFLGSFYWLVAVIIVIIFIQWKKGLNLAVNLSIVQSINHFIKSLVARPRPDSNFHLVKETSYSFPSGHAMASTIFYLIIADYIQQTSFVYKKIIQIGCYLLIFLICISRIYLGVHYFSDVLGGFLFSLSYYLFIKYHNLLNPKHQA